MYVNMIVLVLFAHKMVILKRSYCYMLLFRAFLKKELNEITNNGNLKQPAFQK